MRIINTIIDRIRITIDPIKYWRKRGASIGSECEIYSRANLGSEPYLITIGNHVRITDNVRFVTHDGAIWVLRDKNSGYSEQYINKDRFGRIQICDNVHIGLNSIIMPGVIIGENSIIGCGAVVTKDVPPNSVVAGVPARVIKTLNEYEHTIRETCLDTKNMKREEKEAVLKQYFNLI